jgi:type IV pilus assembly protein PilM
MAKTTGVWGIDIGQCALKALRLELIDGAPTATAFDYIEHPKILSQPDADPDALTREALEKFLARNPLGKDQVAIGVPGQSGLARFVKLPPVEEKKVPDIVKFEAKQQIPFPLEEVVWDYQKLSDKQEVVGGFAMETEIGLFAMKRDIINRFLSHYQGVKAEVNVVQMAPLALANYATYEVLKKRGGEAAGGGEELGELPPGKKKRCVVILDIGTDGSNLIITDGSKIIWQRPVPLGGNNFTRVLTKEMKLTFAKAEHLKRNAAKSPDLAQILKALRPVLTDFVGEVQRSLGYFTNTHRDAHVSYMVGLGSAFKLPGLQKYLSEKLALDVRKPAKFDGVTGDTVLNDPVFTENLLTFPVAYGLALQALAVDQPTADEQKKYALLRTNLLPQEIRTDRLIRAKKPWAAAAAAALLLGSGITAMGYGMQYKAATDEKLLAAKKKAEDSAKARDSQNAEYTKKEGEVKDETNKVKAIVAGNEERLNWVRIHEVVATALPRPPAPPTFAPETGNFLNPAAEDKYVLFKKYDPEFKEFIDAQQAINLYYGRVRQGVPPEKMYDTTLSASLPVINIEAIDCRWTDNLQGFLDNANRYAFQTHGQNIVEDLKDERAIQVPKAKKNPDDPDTEELKLPAEREKTDAPNVRGSDPSKHNYNPKAPEGGAWVVELRGFTYHKDSWVFVRDSLVYNLQNFHLYALKTDPKNDKVGKVLTGVPDPTLGRVSHVFLAAERTTKSDQVTKQNPLKLTLIPSGMLDSLIGGGAGGAPAGGLPGESAAPLSGGKGGGPMMAPGGAEDTGNAPGGGMMPGGGGGGWRSLLSGGRGGGGAAGGMGGMMSGMMGMMGMMGSPDGGEGGPVMGGAMGPGAAPAANAPTGKPGKQQLCEFIVYFIWREPTPTDALNELAQ